MLIQITGKATRDSNAVAAKNWVNPAFILFIESSGNLYHLRAGDASWFITEKECNRILQLINNDPFSQAHRMSEKELTEAGIDL
jgi:hypothetical protein